jgi:hypothetical protein
VEIKRLKEAEAAAKAKEKAQFGGLFNKVSMYNDKDDNVVVPSGSNPKVRGSGHVPIQGGCQVARASQTSPVALRALARGLFPSF